MVLGKSLQCTGGARVRTKRSWRTLLTLVGLSAFALALGLGMGIAQAAARGPARARGVSPDRQPPSARQRTASAPASPTSDAGLEVITGAGGIDTIRMEFYNLDIDHLLRLLSYAAHVTIVKSEQVTGPITVIAPEPVPLDVAFQILDSVLKVRGFTMVRAATGIYKVIPIAEAVESGVPLQFGECLLDTVAGDQLVTQVISLANVDANDVASELQNLLSQNASLVPTSTNSLIITDTAANVERALLLIEEVESQLAGGLKVYPLQYYDASEMASLVDSVVLHRGGAGAAGPRPAWERRVVGRPERQTRPTARPTPQPGGGASTGPEFAYPDTRSNQLIVLATPVHLRQIEDLITQLDRPISLRDAFFVYPVQNLVASELAQLVAPLIGAQVVQSSAGERQQGARSQRGGLASQRGGTYTRPFGTTGTGVRPVFPSSTQGGRRPAQAPRPAVEPLAGEAATARPPAVPGAQAGGEGGTQIAPQPEGEMPGQPQGGEYEDLTALTGAGVAEAIIAADDNTNTILISAPPEQVDLVQQMLERLDVLPPQVFIRAIIAEVQLTRDTSLGFQWQSMGRTWGGYKGDVFTGDVGTGFKVSTPGEDTTPAGLFATLSGSEFEAVLNALTTDSKARILSAPSVFTTNNEAAEINVSTQIPIPTGTFQSTTGSEAISTSIRYESVGIVLQVVPRVTQGDKVRMEVYVTVNEQGEGVDVGGVSYPSIRNRSAEAIVNLGDSDTVVLGGLMRESITRSASRVPILGDLPVVGALFRSTKSSRLKSELLVFLTPKVVRTNEEATELAADQASRLPDIPKSLRDLRSSPEPETDAAEFEWEEQLPGPPSAAGEGPEAPGPSPEPNQPGAPQDTGELASPVAPDPDAPSPTPPAGASSDEPST